MLLTRLEAKGFKSFGDKISLQFGKGVTAVVGPNGSGKSNVVDAIRWVLGEQSSKTLRSDKMENIIFNGTQKRKPLQMAEVSLSFTNDKQLLPTEYAEVTIARRYYRSGDSEYLLNGITCRLRDIQELFMDTGIGPDSYAIIELKMVDNLLNDTNHARRNLFEEAAGISKYKKRKKETERQLLQADADLERVEDLLHEIAGNMRQLERQAKQAKRYLEVKQQYRALRISLARKTTARQLQQQEQLQAELTELQTTRAAATAAIAKAQAALEADKLKLLEAEKLLSSRQKALNAHVEQLRQRETEKRLKNERLRLQEQRLVQLEQQLTQYEQNQQQAQQQLDALQQEQESLARRLLEEEQLHQQAQQQLAQQTEAHKLTQQQLAEHEQLVRNYQQQHYKHRNALEVAEVQLQTLQQQLTEYTAQTGEQSENKNVLDLSIASVQRQLNEQQQLVQAEEAAQEQARQQLQATEAELAEVHQQLNTLKRTKDARSNELRLTKSMVENMEGYPDAIRFLRKQPDFGKKVPLLTEIISAEAPYRLPLENYLEPWLNYYIVADEAQALKAVDLLAASAKGRASFFLLNKFAAVATEAAPTFEQAVQGLSVVSFPERYRQLVTVLLQKVYIRQAGAAAAQWLFR